LSAVPPAENTARAAAATVTPPLDPVAAAGVADEPFTISLKVGTRDANGAFLGGTEIINLVDFGGKLYAGNGYWEDVPGTDPASGPQVLVLDGPNAAWRQERAFSDKDWKGQFLYGRLTSLDVLTFTTDGQGKALAAPVAILAVGLEHKAAGMPGAVFTRGDDGTWTQVSMRLPPRLSVRALAVHKDAVTGVDKLFIGAGEGSGRTPGAILSGFYDPTAKGRIRVSPTPEYAGFTHRVMSFAEATRTLLFAAAGGVYGRTDGAQPTWSQVAAVVPPPPAPNKDDSHNSGLRGLTPLGGTSGVLGGMEGRSGPIMRLDTAAHFSPSVELKVGDLLHSRWDVSADQYVISAYNDMPLVADPRSGSLVNLIGLQAHNPKRETSAWYLVRSKTGDYSLHEVPPLTTGSPRGLIAVRTMHVSPFPADNGQVLYLGGYDADFKPSHNSAWLYRVGLQTALATP
jgi:hypothetical protein